MSLFCICSGLSHLLKDVHVLSRKDFLLSECKCPIREPYAKDSGRLTIVGILIFMSRINFSLS